MNIKKQFIFLTILSVSSNVSSMTRYHVSHENIKANLFKARQETLQDFLKPQKIQGDKNFNAAATSKAIAESRYHENAFLVAGATTALASPVLHTMGNHLAAMAPTCSFRTLPNGGAGILTLLALGIYYIESLPASLYNNLSQAVCYSLPFIAFFGTAGIRYLYYQSDAVDALAVKHKSALVQSYKNKLAQELATLKQGAAKESFNDAINNVYFMSQSDIFKGDTDFYQATQEVLTSLRITSV